MAALTKEFGGPTQGQTQHYDYVTSHKQATNVINFNGALIMSSATGYAVPAADTANCKVLGRANSTVNSTASGPSGLVADGVLEVEYTTGVFTYDNPTGANQLTQADVGRLAYVLSDHEVTRAAGTTNSVIAGVVKRVDLVANTATIDTRTRAV